MEKMKLDEPLDFAVFQLSPERSRCELFVYGGGSTEKLASGLLKPFVAHLKVAEEQVASAAQSIKLEVGRRRNAEVWFTKGTLERFVRFVSTPEVLELVNTFDAEMSQLEAARRIYSQGAGDQLSGGGGSAVTAADDATKKELIRAIDLRLVTVQQDLSTTCTRADAAGFNVETVSELQTFADTFGAHRLNEACGKFISLCERRPNLIRQWKPGPEDRAVRSSCGSDMSIDDDDPPSPPPRQESATCQPSNPPPATFPLRSPFSRESSVERDDANKRNSACGEKERKDDIDTSTPDQPGSIQASQPARRLSVQDRINLFENKQKESSGGKPAVVKSVELRRLSSDVSMTMGVAAEKAVLRRWSGASDMSIDLSAEKKDTESPLCTPYSATLFPDNKDLDLNNDTSKSSSVVKPEIKVIPSLIRDSDSRLKDGFNKSGQFSEPSESNSDLVPGGSNGLHDQVVGKTQSRSSISGVENQENSEEQPTTLIGKNESDVLLGDQGKSKGSQIGEDLTRSQSQIAVVKDQRSSLAKFRPIGSKGGGHVNFQNQREDSESRLESVKQTNLKSTSKNTGESWSSGSRIREAFVARYKGIEDDSFSAQQDVGSVGENEVVEKKESCPSEKVSTGSVSEVEGSGPGRMKFNRLGSGAEHSKKAKVQLDENCLSGNIIMSFSGEIKTEAQEGFDSFSTPPPDQVQRVRQPKGNQELNFELKMKANELEKLFAEHKLRVPGDQSNSSHKGKLEDAQREPASSLHYSRPVADITPHLSDNYKSNEPTGSLKNKTKSNASSLMRTIDSKNYADALNKNFLDLSVSDASRGKLYDRYIQKRDAKLKEDWSSNRADKEVRLKSMQDSLERNRSEMKAKFPGSADRHASVSSARRCAERLRSYNSRSIMNKEQQSIGFGDSEDDEEALDFLEKNSRREDRPSDDISVGDVIKGAQGKKLLPNNRNSSSSISHTSAAPVPRSATKTSNSSVKRRAQPENPLAQSVPNFSALRKENTKPSGGSKTTRLQVRNYARSKSTNEEAVIVKEDSCRVQALRKSSANSSEFREMSPLDSDDAVLTPIKFDMEVLKNVGTKPFLKKGSRGFAARTSVARQRTSLVPEPVNNIEENDGMASALDEVESTVKDKGEEEYETSNTEGNKVLEAGEPIPRLDSVKSVNSGSENGDGTLSFSRVDQALGSQLPSEIPSSFLPIDSVQDWPGESPISWNSRAQHPFSYPHEMSDIDPSVDSPVGSPLWNSQSLKQMEADAARMRKKWGTAQKPTLVAHSSNNSSRKDMTRGFKRLLKFGRKNRGSESLVDWISATTSEGDDDTEDGRDPANRSSDDLRKSRMGFSQAEPSDDSFNESLFFSESVQSSHSSIPAPPPDFELREDHISGTSIKAPRSFFSLSTFRSKGSESKPR